MDFIFVMRGKGQAERGRLNGVFLFSFYCIYDDGFLEGVLHFLYCKYFVVQFCFRVVPIFSDVFHVSNALLECML